METRRILSETTPQPAVGYLIPVHSGPLSVTEVREFLTIGRDPGNGLILSDITVSGRHARIERRHSGFVLRDHGSSNGTYLNGMRITEAVLNINDRVRFGESVFAFSETSTTSRLTSRNESWNRQLQRLPAFAVTDFPVLVTGPSGTGKEILARTIHESSTRSSGPFVTINCSALSESLIESELFGHTRGSFTGATHDRKGAFESARGGTLFLDEVGDLPTSLQPKLLRALENREIRPVGSDRVIDTDVRIIAATHKDLVHEAVLGRFREDLFYRLNVCAIKPPALATRMEDFEDLLYHFARAMRVRFSFDAITKLKEHSWPGNVRELKNVVSRAAAYLPGEHVQPEHIEQLLDQTRLLANLSQDPMRELTSGQAATGLSMIKEIERQMIIQRLIVNSGNQRRTAADLGLPKSTLHDRIRSYKIDLDALGKQYKV